VVLALAAAPDGRLFAGGVFTSIGNVLVNNIAEFDGTNWKPLISGTLSSSTQAVRSLRLLENGDLIVGGSFDRIGSVSTSAPLVNGIARWNGSEWSGIGGGFPTGFATAGVRATVVTLDGVLYAASLSALTGGSALAWFDGAAWKPVPDAPNGITSMVAHPEGGVVIAGTFTTVSGNPAPGLAHWNGSAWSLLPTDPGLTITSTDAVSDSRDGGFRLVVNDAQPARWASGRVVADGSAFPVDATGGNTRAVTDLEDGGLIVLGYNRAAPFNGAALRFNGTWEPLNALSSNAPNRAVNILLPLSDGNVLAAGDFNRVGGVSANAAIYDGVAWASRPWPALLTTSAAIHAPNGDLIVAGGPTSSTGAAVHRWNGTTWSKVGTTLSGQVFALAVLNNGDVVAAGTVSSNGTTSVNNIVRWNGTTWRQVGVGTNGPVYALSVLPDGDLVVGGGFNVIGANSTGEGIMRFRGDVAFTMGSGIGPSAIVTALARSSTGELHAAGRFERFNGDVADCVARWTGSAWVPIAFGDYPRGYVSSLAFDAQDRPIIAGTLSGSTTARRSTVWRCDAGVWRDLGEGLESTVSTLAWTSKLGLVAGGNFTLAGSTLTPNFTRLACMPNACPLDFDTDGILSDADFFAFVDKFNDGDPATDFNQDDALSFEDFDFFVAALIQGC